MLCYHFFHNFDDFLFFFISQKERFSLMNLSQSNKETTDVGSSSDGPLSGSFHACTSSASTSLSNPISSSIGCGDESATGTDTRQGIDQMQRNDMKRTRSLDRSNDNVYAATTKVVKAIMLLSQSVDKAAASQYLDLVLHVGNELRALLTSVDTLALTFPALAMKWVLRSHWACVKSLITNINVNTFAERWRWPIKCSLRICRSWRLQCAWQYNIVKPR